MKPEILTPRSLLFPRLALVKQLPDPQFLTVSQFQIATTIEALQRQIVLRIVIVKTGAKNRLPFEENQVIYRFVPQISGH